MQYENVAFDQLHIDIARNSTDDFNPFHDPRRWSAICGNPFAGPIALGFQLEFFCSDRIQRARVAQKLDLALPYRNFEFNFAGALPAGEPGQLDVRKTVDKRASGGGLSNRVLLRKADGAPVLLGSQSDTVKPRFWNGIDITGLAGLSHLADRSMIPGRDLFLKRKFLTTSNAKNFAIAALCDQQDYIDELDESVAFPPLFTAAMSSCALLERATASGHDFTTEPLVYTSHQISVDMRLQSQLRSNDLIHFLVSAPETRATGKGLGKACVEQSSLFCMAILEDGQTLFHAKLQLASLAAVSAVSNSNVSSATSKAVASPR
ncbi:MAG: hypothetical protein AAF098_08990 [Pseudomonadota bacterium]